MASRDSEYVRDDLLSEKCLYDRNRGLFLIQSALLGISYAIVWPTLWMYVEQEFPLLNLTCKKLLYGCVYVAYPMSSMISAHFVQKATINTRFLFLTLNLAEVAGNLIYALNFHPFCLVIGRFIAGSGDAFYVIIMRDLKLSHSRKSGSVAAECLCAFIVGLVLAQMLNAFTAFIPFQLGAWVLNSNNYPGLTACILFSIMTIVIRLSLEIPEDEQESRRQPTVDGKKEARLMLQHNGPKSLFISFFSFVHTYVVSMFEILIPILLYEKLHASAISSILMYGFIGMLYAMILMFTMTVESGMVLELFMLCSVFFKMLALLAAICLVIVPMTNIHAIMALIGIMVAITFMWSNDDVMYTNLIMTMIPSRVRDESHKLRKTTSKLAFLLAGITVPFFYSPAMLYFGSVLMVFIGLLFIVFVMLRLFSTVKRVKV